MNTIALAALEQIAGVKSNAWKPGNGKIRHYLNIPGAAYKAYWVPVAPDSVEGRLYFSMARGRSTDAANAVARAMLGCNPTDRYSRTAGPAAYVVIED